jgi:hypothetical protein
VHSVPDSGEFGDVCVGEFRDLPLTLSNSGECSLTISGISSSSPEFIVPGVDAFPLTMAPHTSVTLSLRFRPTSFGAKNATITVTSDDPASPGTLDVSGIAPSGELAVTGTTRFGAVELGSRALQTISICNVGDCDLHVTRVAFKPLTPCEKYRQGGCDREHMCDHGCRPCSDEMPHRHWYHEDDDQRYADNNESNRMRRRDKRCDCDQHCLNFEIITNPFPAEVRPGSCLDVLIEYVPTCDNAACCELVIESDDPNNPTETLFVTGRLRRTLHSTVKCWAAPQLQEILEAGKN